MTLADSEKKILISHRIRQSNEALKHAKFLTKNKMLSLAVNRIYYSIFYVISAVALKNNFSTSKHITLLGWFNKNFIASGLIDKKYGKLIYKTFQNREKSDYAYLFELTKKEVLNYLKQSQEFVDIVAENLLN